MEIVCSGGATDDVPRSTESAICSDTSVGASCDWGTDRGGKVLLVSGDPIEKERMLFGSGIPDEVEKMVLSSNASAGSWCFSDPFSWLELDWARGHRHLMFERSWSLMICQSAVATTKIS